ncbi:MAG: tRNA (adenosine(37)-N6)-threonylcarbamoyltransferase complex dimerization subunit type 1 TsaB [Lachnospiraceae bacterium]|nr:tRNA (adenosine(37)-N6)-threonylcarbamoyltransferase complex dimerization subunit type 1 TsaB [Lachnospiraceae bacterium]MDY4970816.1 tRNA (adenosine(37)-N6)-threonylcarbamoyltransferase complex dimerization subunit type 1 TsaB [Lachnospiraceae bacterium]
MKILGIESAAMTASAAVLEDDHLTAEYTIDYKKTHSQTLLPMIAEIRDMIQLDLDTLDAIAVSGGPGSFTGLRIGSTTAKGLGLALNKELIHVPTLDAMAYQIFGVPGLICALMDARKENVFAGIYRNEEKFEIVKPACHINIHDLAELLNRLGEPVILTGDGADAYMMQLQENCTVSLRRAPAFACRARAGAVAALGLIYYKEGRTESAAAHVPDYLRVSQAERQLAEAEKKLLAGSAGDAL